MSKSKEWQSLKGYAGLQFREYKGQKTWRQVYRHTGDTKQYRDYFGLMDELEAKKFALMFTDNRRQGISPMSYAEMQSQQTEKNKAQVITEERERKKLIEEQDFADANTVASYWDREYWPKRSKRGSTVSNNNILASFNKWIRAHLGNVPLVELKSQHIEDLFQSMTAAGSKPRNLQYIYGILQNMYNDAQIHFSEHTALPIFPGKKLKLPSVNNEKTCYLSVEEAHKLLDLLYNWQEHCKEHKIRIRSLDTIKDAYCMALLSLLTGLRFGDIASLKWQDVVGDIAYIRNPKNNKGYTVNISHDSLQEMFAERQTTSPTDLIFKNAKSEQYTQPPRIFYKAVQTLGLNQAPHRLNNKYEHIDFHSLRHTYGSWLAMMGTNLHEIKELLGHTTLKMTLRYARLNPNSVQQNAIKLAQNFSEKKSITA